MASLRRVLMSGGGRFWLRLLMVLWLLVVLALLSTRFVGQGCRKRTFAHRDDLEASTHGKACSFSSAGYFHQLTFFPSKFIKQTFSLSNTIVGLPGSVTITRTLLAGAGDMFSHFVSLLLEW